MSVSINTKAGDVSLPIGEQSAAVSGLGLESTSEKETLVISTSDQSLTKEEIAAYQNRLIQRMMNKCIRTSPCAIICSLALPALCFIAVDQAQKISAKAGSDYYAEHYNLMLHNATAAAEILTQKFNEQNSYILSHYLPALGLGLFDGVISGTYMYAVSQLEVGGENSISKTQRIFSGVFSLATMAAGGVATAAGLTYGGPIVIGVGLTGLSMSAMPVKTLASLNLKASTCLRSTCNAVSSCFRRLFCCRA